MDPSNDVYKRLAENMSDMVALHTADGRFLWISPSVERILGYSPTELVGTNPYDLFHPDDVDSIRNRTHQPAMTGDGNILIRYRIRRSCGEYIWFETLTQPIRNDRGEITELHTTSRNVTEQRQLEDALAESEALYRAAMESLEEGVIVHGADGQIIAHNPRAAEILGLSNDELNGRVSRDPLWDSVYPDGTSFPAEAHPVMVTLRTGEPCFHVLMGVHTPRWQARRWISINSRPIPVVTGEGERPTKVVVSFNDVPERIERESQLQRWSTVYRFSGEAIVIVDAGGVIQDVNEAFERIVKNKKAAWLGRRVDEITLESRSEELFASTIWPILASSDNWRGELWLRDAQGGTQATWAAMTKTKQRTAFDAHYTLILSDFSERSTKEANLRHYASHDSLTGLPNRLLLNDRFVVAVNTAVRQGSTFACLYLDLDGFKPINDCYGHGVGDSLLQRVAEKILENVRAVDTVSRIGGDEFCAIISGLQYESDYQILAMRIARAIGGRVSIEGHDLSIGVSIGVALYPKHGESQKELMEASDAAMYRAKRQGLSVEIADTDI
jgi:diguanylate cyclase (GGDEF)-like protein/PAS domain S-box-containing protein